MIKGDVSSSISNEIPKNDLAEKIGTIINNEVTIKKDNSNELIKNILNKFPGSTVTEIE